MFRESCATRARDARTAKTLFAGFFGTFHAARCIGSDREPGSGRVRDRMAVQRPALSASGLGAGAVGTGLAEPAGEDPQHPHGDHEYQTRDRHAAETEEQLGKAGHIACGLPRDERALDDLLAGKMSSGAAWPPMMMP